MLSPCDVHSVHVSVSEARSWVTAVLSPRLSQPSRKTGTRALFSSALIRRERHHYLETCCIPEILLLETPQKGFDSRSVLVAEGRDHWRWNWACFIRCGSLLLPAKQQCVAGRALRGERRMLSLLSCTYQRCPLGRGEHTNNLADWGHGTRCTVGACGYEEAPQKTLFPESPLRICRIPLSITHSFYFFFFELKDFNNL